MLCATCGQWILSRLHLHIWQSRLAKRWFLSVINTLIHPIPSRSTFCSGFGVAALECHPLIDSSALAHPKLGSKLKATTRWAEFLLNVPEICTWCCFYVQLRSKRSNKTGCGANSAVIAAASNFLAPRNGEEKSQHDLLAVDACCMCFVERRFVHVRPFKKISLNSLLERR